MCRECNAVFFTAFNSGLSLLPGEPNIFPAFSRAWQLSERKCCFIMFVVDVFCCIFFFIVSVRFGWVNLQNFQTLITKKLKIITSSSSFYPHLCEKSQDFQLNLRAIKDRVHCRQGPQSNTMTTGNLGSTVTAVSRKKWNLQSNMVSCWFDQSVDIVKTMRQKQNKTRLYN